MSDGHWQERIENIHRRFVGDKWEVGSAEDIRFLTLALAGEVGELANLIKKRWRGDEVPDSAIASELSDIRIYLELVALYQSVDWRSLCHAKLDEVEERMARKGI
jgi:NTP pyrophosphatase (non-canonical NTP hydrolase)